ncbi:MAG: hypothetical protein AUH43_14550 [Acidobacteria bacterium 13_1_40CM_65_14]|nr:MAG: hypothetical protein AUH43_14550 [Acidobacteria bacterium 13_1_40CM_65_14]OLC79684.1 MAG: hypothetical protein AUH72_14105 [Acidobacteria bacterium 13_1_40CM_4_65_8]
MRHRLHLFHIGLAALFIAALATTTAAQTGRVGGTVKDDAGQAIKGATITAENPNASPSSFTATTDDKGRFSIIGLRTGRWTFTAQAPGFAPESGGLNVQTIGAPNPPLTFTLRKGATAGPSSALGSLAAKDLQAELGAADALYNSQKWDEAITAYRAIMAKAPALSVINLQIAAVYRNKKEYDNAIAAYNELLKADPTNDKAKIGIGMTNLEKGDLAAAEDTLTKAAEGANPTREVFYNLGEVKFAKGQIDDAAKYYQKAADMDATWGKPLFKLALVELNKLGQIKDTEKEELIKTRAKVIAALEKVVAADPTSQEAAQAKAVVEQLKK